MRQEEYLKLHELLCYQARALSARKGHDYSGQADTLANLKRTAALGITSAPLGTLVRLGDKISRLVSLLRPGFEAQVTDETILDTHLDAINYCTLSYALLVDEGKVAMPSEESDEA